MQSKVEIYSRMLDVQADMAYGQERIFFQNNFWNSSSSVLDFGSGNSSYAVRLYDNYEQKYICCIEADVEMRSIAQQKISGRSIDLFPTIEDERVNNRFDFFIFRLVLLHLADRGQAYQIARDYSLPNSHALILDADDEHFVINPEPKCFLNALHNLRSKSVNRSLLDICQDEFNQFGFIPCVSHRIIVNSDGNERKLQMYLYMKLTAQLANEGQINPIIEEELLHWYFNPASYAQYGVFGTLFKNNNGD